METSEYKILLVDDEDDILEFVGYNLKKQGFNVYTAQNGKTAIAMAEQHHPHLILLDVMMPEMDGIETCEELRKREKLGDIIIAMLTARSEDYSQIAGFDAGADDYITKPIKPKVLISKVKALLKRYNPGGSQLGGSDENSIITLNSLSIDKERYVVDNSETQFVLPRKEFELLYLLVSKPGKVFTREEIYSRVWGDAVIVGDRTIDVHIRKLREKIGKDYITTIKGVGYKFNTDAE